MDSETPLNIMQRATMGYDSGILTLNQALEILNLPAAKKGEGEKKSSSDATINELPRENTQPGAEDEQR